MNNAKPLGCSKNDLDRVVGDAFSEYLAEGDAIRAEFDDIVLKWKEDAQRRKDAKAVARLLKKRMVGTEDVTHVFNVALGVDVDINLEKPIIDTAIAHGYMGQMNVVQLRIYIQRGLRVHPDNPACLTYRHHGSPCLDSPEKGDISFRRS